MKLSAYIFSSIFVLVLALLHLQPLMYGNQASEEESCEMTCQRKSPCSGKEDDNKNKQDNNDCNNKGCNPFVPCSMGACCYLVENFYVQGNLLIYKKQLLPLFNDSRLSSKMSDCWHPPEII